jgi:SAM-dependent methyltransferase
MRPIILTTKPPDYYESDRRDFLDWIGGRYRRVLDIGCGKGASNAWYREHGAADVTGIELDPTSAAAAALVFDRVLVGTVEEVLGSQALDGPFDLIVCADVLEHLVDPWTVVTQLGLIASPTTVLAVSVPNIRYLRALLRIGFGRGFDYEERGIFDATHLRFFVRRNIERLLVDSGWRPTGWGCPGRGRLAIVRRVARKLTRGRSDEWLGLQIYARAVPTPMAPLGALSPR